MHEHAVSKKIALIISAYVAVFFLTIVIVDFSNNHTTVVFCDVGRGDATYIRVRNKTDVLIDAGGSSLVTTCLGKHMPYYDRTIEIAFITLASKNQYEGYRHILKRYDIKNLVVNAYYSKKVGYNEILNQLSKTGTRIHLSSATPILIDDTQMFFISPRLDTGERFIPSTQRSLSIGFKQYGTTVLIIGHLFPNEYKIILKYMSTPNNIVKIPEYGIENTTYLDLLSQAKITHLLINRQEFKANLLHTYSLRDQRKLRSVAGSGDLVYRL